MTSTAAQANITRVYRRATAEERAAGHAWYADASEMIHSIAAARRLNADTVAAVIAVLSPSVSWEHNVDVARRVLGGARGKEARYFGYPANLKKAERILDGESPETVLGGYKVSAFYRLLREPNAWDVCVDTIGATAARDGYRATSWRHDPPRVGHYRQYEEVAAAYRAVAWRWRLAPWQVQATVWLVMKRLGKQGAEGKAVQHAVSE